jgi:uncharacterized protein (DUF427 family)
MKPKNQKFKESVWDYPRPPRLELSSKHLKVVFGGVVIAETTKALKVCETSHPPVYYFPPEDVQKDLLIPAGKRSECEWKGSASYYTVSVNGNTAENAAWYYPDPRSRFRALRNHIAFYPRKMDACYVDGEEVQAQPGDFYGGWITSDVIGPFKGGPESIGW